MVVFTLNNQVSISMQEIVDCAFEDEVERLMLGMLRKSLKRYCCLLGCHLGYLKRFRCEGNEELMEYQTDCVNGLRLAVAGLEETLDTLMEKGFGGIQEYWKARGANKFDWGLEI